MNVQHLKTAIRLLSPICKDIKLEDNSIILFVHDMHPNTDIAMRVKNLGGIPRGVDVVTAWELPVVEVEEITLSGCQGCGKDFPEKTDERPYCDECVDKIHEVPVSHNSEQKNYDKEKGA